jgi:deoxyribose-phosphate aldolase
MRSIVEAVKAMKPVVIVKFIIETGFLTDEEIKRAASLVLKAKGDFVKTCSGMGPRGARLTDVKLIREAIGTTIPIKVAGGVHDYKTAKAFIQAGANRIGTSAAVEIVKEAGKDND